MRRRDFIAGIAGLAAGWPHATRAQQNDQVRRMGLLMPYAMSNAEAQASSNALLHGLRELGWIEGRNLEVEYRFAGAGTEDLRIKALELAALQIDVIIARATPAVIALATATKKIPIVFTVVNDPVGSGFVESWARQVATSPALQISSLLSQANGSKSSKRLLRMLRELQSSLILRRHPVMDRPL